MLLLLQRGLIMNIINIFILLIVQTQPMLNIDFGKDKMGVDWNVINDGVMGGLSQGKVAYLENSVHFKGSVSLENNGGFSSFKSPFDKNDMTGFTSVTIRYKSKGIATALTLETNYRFYQPYYKYSLEKTDNWKTITIPLEDFYAYRMGRKMGQTMDGDQVKDIVRLGFITNEKRAGAFELEVDFLRFN